MSNLATIVNNILADSGIDDINVVVTNGSYSNPAWITALSWSKITGTPTTLAGYGITNGVPTSRTLTINGVSYDLSADRTWTIASGVTSVNAGTGISVNATTGAVTVTNTGVLSINGSTGAVTGILTTSNYNSYAPTLTGGGASGTWGISITGTAAGETLATVTGRGATTTSPITINGGGSQPLTLTTSSSSPWALNLYRSDIASNTRVFNNGGYWYFEHRPQFNGSWALDAGNYNSYAPTLTGGGASGTWGINITGNAATATSATSAGNANTLDGLDSTDFMRNYGMLNNTDVYVNFRVMRNSNTSSVNDGMYIGYANSNSGITRIFGGGATTGELIKYSNYTYEPGSFRAPYFYDSDDTGYYLKPNGESKIKKLWINNGGAAGVSWSTGLNMGDSANYWNLIQDAGTARQRNFGTGGYDWYNNSASTQLMLLSNSGNLTVSGDMRAPIFYDSNDTNYYADFHSTSNSGIRLRGGMLIGPNTTWGAYLQVGGNGHVSSSYANVVTTNGNLHLDAASGRDIYLGNYVNSIIYLNTSGYYISSNGSYYNGTSATTSQTNFSNLTIGGSQVWYNSGSWLGDLGSYGFTRAWGLSMVGGAEFVLLYKSGQGYTLVDGSYYAYEGGGFYSSNNSAGNTLLGFYADTTSSVNFNTGTVKANGNTILHAGNYNSYAPTLTGGGASGTWGISISGTSANTNSISSATGSSYTWGSQQYFQSNLGGYCGSLSGPPLQAYATGGNSAFMSFHRSGNYAVNMGLDADNVLRIGGWSASANRWELDMSGNCWVASSFRAPVFYDSANTSYYLDPNATGTSLNVAGRMTGASWTTSGRNYCNEWIEFPNYSGLYSPLNGAHFYPNNSSYGSWRIAGSRNGWGGIEFDRAHQVSLMVNHNEVGFHNNSYGWQINWYQGTLYVGKGTYGGSNATVLDSSNSPYAWNMNQYVRTSDTVNFSSVQVNGGAAGYTLGVNGSIYCVGGGGMYALYANGDIYATGNVTAYSDARVKTNIRSIENALDRVLKSRGVIYDRNDKESNNNIGFIAQELEEQFPELVSTDQEGRKGVMYQNMVAVLLEAVKEQQKEINELKSKLA